MSFRLSPKAETHICLHFSFTNLTDEVLEVRGVGVEPVEVGVEGKVGEGLPGRLVALDLDGVHADGRVVPDGRGGHHGDAVHGPVTHLAAVLKMEESNVSFYSNKCASTVCVNDESPSCVKR